MGTLSYQLDMEAQQQQQQQQRQRQLWYVWSGNRKGNVKLNAGHVAGFMAKKRPPNAD